MNSELFHGLLCLSKCIWVNTIGCVLHKHKQLRENQICIGLKTLTAFCNTLAAVCVLNAV